MAGALSYPDSSGGQPSMATVAALEQAVATTVGQQGGSHT
jgi:hypothetical protein